MADVPNPDRRGANPTFTLQNDFPTEDGVSLPVSPEPRRPASGRANTFFVTDLALRATPEAQRQAEMQVLVDACARQGRSEAMSLSLYGRGGAHLGSEVRSLGEFWTAVIGRHQAAELRAKSASLSLRHGFVLHEPHSPTVEMWDLRSGSGLSHNGEKFVHRRLQMPACVRFGELYLVVMNGPASPEDFVAAPGKDKSAGQASLTNADAWLMTTEQYRIDYNWRDSRANQPDERLQMQLTTEQLQRGVILGRSDRCDSPRNWSTYPSDLSRVHALLVATGEGTYFVDTASSGKVRSLSGDEIRVKRLQPGDSFWLGRQTRVTFEKVRATS